MGPEDKTTNDLFGFNLEDDSESEPTNKHNENDVASQDAVNVRGYQSEAEFQAVKASYRPKIENGEVLNIQYS